MGRIWDGTRNGDWHADRRKLQQSWLDAAGFDRRTSTDTQPMFNGGVSAPRETTVQKGDKIYRFNDSRIKTLEAQVSGRWWFDEDTCLTLMKHCRADMSKFRDTARSAFAVLTEWGDMCFLVSGTVKYNFWAIKGMTAAAQSRREKVINPYGDNILQLFVPGGFKVDDFIQVRPVGITRNAY